VSDTPAASLPVRRACPHCQGEISAKATRCKHCLQEVNAIAESIASGGTSAGSHEAAVEKPIAAVATTTGERRYRYQVVPFIGAVRSGFFSSDNAATVSAQLQNLIERHAQHGWEFYSVEKVDIEVSPGCLGRLLGQSASYITFDQVIFRQPIAMDR